MGRNLSYESSKAAGISPFYSYLQTLTSVTIGDSVTSICLLGETPPTVGSDNFTNKHYIDLSIYVPQGSIATYQSADVWKDFWDIQEFNVTAIENVEDVTPEIELKSSGIRFNAADGKAIAVYTTNGALVEKIGNYAGEEYTLDKGVYIVRVGEKTMKKSCKQANLHKTSKACLPTRRIDRLFPLNHPFRHIIL